jgi:hypothetical protein
VANRTRPQMVCACESEPRNGLCHADAPLWLPALVATVTVAAGGKLAIPSRWPRHVLGSSRAGYFTLNVRHFVLAAVCAAVLAIVARMW